MQNIQGEIRQAYIPPFPDYESYLAQQIHLKFHLSISSKCISGTFQHQHYGTYISPTPTLTVLGLTPIITCYMLLSFTFLALS